MNRSIIVNGRVLHGSITGVQRYASQIIKNLNDKIEVVCPTDNAQGIRGHAWEQLALPLKTGRNLLFSPSNTGPILVKRQVITIHDVAALDHPERLNPKFAAWYKFLTPILAKRSSRIITISDYSKQRLLNHVEIDENKVIVIPNGVEERFSPLNKSSVNDLTLKIRLPSKKYVLCVGTLEPRKNISRLLKAWSRISSKISDDIWLVLAGKQGDSKLFAQIAGLNELPQRVYITGHIVDELLPSLYAGAMIFAFPSLYEGFGLPPLEAMASGVPVLTGNNTSLPEVVGNAGMMVDVTDVDAISEGLIKLLENKDLRNFYIKEGLMQASKFNWSSSAQKTWFVLQEAACD